MAINDPMTHAIIGCAMEVHNVLGNGFQACPEPCRREVIYQRALAIELEEKGIGFRREQEMPLFYKGKEIGARRVDFLVERKVLVELKALIALEDVHASTLLSTGLAQTLNYLTAYDLPIVLLINFPEPSLNSNGCF